MKKLDDSNQSAPSPNPGNAFSGDRPSATPSEDAPGRLSPLTRRSWLKRNAAGLVGLGAGALLSPSLLSRAAGANGDIRVAVIGLRIRGAQLIDAFSRVPGVRIVAICDADSEILEEHRQKAAERGMPVDAVVDFRRLLDRPDVDAVVIATPDHWHAVMAVWACEAGKDVYVEKPVSHNIWEGGRMVAAAQKHNRIVQTGTQNRSDIGFREAEAYLRRGELGDIRFAWIINYVSRQGIGKVNGPQNIPDAVNYDLYQGPADRVPLRRKNLHYDWHWDWATGTGECGNRGVHAFDHARWLMGESGMPTGIQTIGGRLGWNDDGETPNTQITLFEGLKVPMLYELRNLPEAAGSKKVDKFRGHGTTMFIDCEEGYIIGGRGFLLVHDHNRKLIRRFKCDGGKGHQANFIAGMRSRQTEDLYSDINEGRISSNYCHLANLSFQTGRTCPVGEITRAAQMPTEFGESFERLQQHLDANRINLAQTPLTLGPRLTFDTKTERFQGEASDWANLYLRRNYRAPFVISENA